MTDLLPIALILAVILIVAIAIAWRCERFRKPAIGAAAAIGAALGAVILAII